MNIVKKGNDAIFSVFLFKDNQGGLKLTADNVQDFEPLNVYDPNIEPRLRDSIRVEVEHLYPTYLQDVPHRAGNALNELRVELPADLQQLGDFNIVVNFEYKATELEDGWRAVRLKGFLCKVVETDAETDESTSPLRLFVSPILKGERGEKGDKGEKGEQGEAGEQGRSPVIEIEQDPKDQKHYLKIDGNFATNAKGEKFVFPSNTSDLIDYVPKFPKPFVFYVDWSKGYGYGWMPSADDRFRGQFVGLNSLSQICYWSNMGYSITPPWNGFIKDGFYFYGLYVNFPNINKQPIYEDLKAGKRFVLLMRIKTDGEGQVILQSWGNGFTLSTNTPDNISCDISYPCELNTGEIKLEIRTPNTRNLGGASFVITDFCFAEVTEERWQELKKYDWSI